MKSFNFPKCCCVTRVWFLIQCNNIDSLICTQMKIFVESYLGSMSDTKRLLCKLVLNPDKYVLQSFWNILIIKKRTWDATWSRTHWSKLWKMLFRNFKQAVDKPGGMCTCGICIIDMTQGLKRKRWRSVNHWSSGFAVSSNVLCVWWYLMGGYIPGCHSL